jgi:hypothetical protein
VLDWAAMGLCQWQVPALDFSRGSEQ